MTKSYLGLSVLVLAVYVENVHHDFPPLVFTVQRLLSYRECFYEDNLNLPLKCSFILQTLPSYLYVATLLLI